VQLFVLKSDMLLLIGFDIYNVQRSSPNLVRHIPVSPGRLPAYYCRGVAFGEGARALMCGTDHGSVHVFELKTVRQIQSLVHEEGMSPLQGF